MFLKETVFRRCWVRLGTFLGQRSLWKNVLLCTSGGGDVGTAVFSHFFFSISKNVQILTFTLGYFSQSHDFGVEGKVKILVKSTFVETVLF